MKTIMIAILFLSVFSSCGNNSGKETTVAQSDTMVNTNQPDPSNDVRLVENSENMKASIETMAASLKKEEIMLKDTRANASIKQKWMRMDVYRDSSGSVRRIKLYPHQGISERSEEFYYDNGQLFFVYISDKGVNSENNDEGKPGKEFHFVAGRLVKYQDNSGDKEMNEGDEKKAYELELPLEAKEYLEIAKSK